MGSVLGWNFYELIEFLGVNSSLWLHLGSSPQHREEGVMSEP